MLTLDNYELVPVNAITVPPNAGCFIVYGASFWVIVDECVLFYKGYSAQCNSNEKIVRRLAGDKEVRLIDRAYVPIYARDYDIDIKALRK